MVQVTRSTRNTRYYSGKPSAFCTLHRGEGSLRRSGTRTITAMEMGYATPVLRDVAVGRTVVRLPPVQGGDITAHAERSSGIEDFPDTSDYSMVVSSRACQVLMQRAGEDLQALPVRVDCDGVVIADRFWIIAATRTVACLDLAASERFVVSTDPLFRLKVVIDPLLFPSGVNACRVPEFAQMIFRGSLVEALLDAGCTGFTAQEVPSIDHHGLG